MAAVLKTIQFTHDCFTAINLKIN